MRTLRQLLVFLLALGVMAGCARGPRLIPRPKMKTILKEFYVNDQWFIQNHAFRRQADTALVYEPVLRRYGYTTDDYLHSLEHYMRDPDKFAKLVKAGFTELSDEVTRLHKLQDALREEAERRRHEPWTPVEFEDVDYLQQPVIPKRWPTPLLEPLELTPPDFDQPDPDPEL